MAKLHDPKISVIMPTYNRAHCLGKAIESVLAQDFADFELIIIDDGSTDTTEEVLRRYACVDQRITTLRNRYNSRKHLIPWEPRNDGLRIARGSLIAYLDSDNTWAKNFLSEMERVFSGEQLIQLAYCDSVNYYETEAQFHNVTSGDRRNLVFKDAASLSASFSCDDLSGDPGIDWYIDTNEMVHRASIFRELRYLWAISHKNRDVINATQTIRRPYRRHNDQDLAERVIGKFGREAVVHIKKPLVNFSYRTEGITTHVHNEKVSKDVLRAGNGLDARELNTDKFYSSYLTRDHDSNSVVEFGLGELHGPHNKNLLADLQNFSFTPEIVESLTKYNGISMLGDAIGEFVKRYNILGLKGLDRTSITPFDGGHNALYHAVYVLSHFVSPAYKSRIAFMVPSYPYWSICAAASAPWLAIEAYEFSEYLHKLEAYNGADLCALIINTPNNPLGIAISRRDIERINCIAMKLGINIIVDIPYWTLQDCTDALDGLDQSRCIIIDSASKSFGLPGLRMGFAISTNSDINALIRAHKSASSLLPSAFKFLILNFLRGSSLESSIKQLVDHRRSEAEMFFSANALPAHTSRLTAGRRSLFDVFEFSSEHAFSNLAEPEIAETLLSRHSIRVMGGQQLFPNLFKKEKETQMIRISYGREADVRKALLALLSAISPANHRKQQVTL